VGLLTHTAISLVAVMAYVLTCTVQDHWRLRRWAADWDRVEPVWTGKVR